MINGFHSIARAGRPCHPGRRPWHGRPVRALAAAVVAPGVAPVLEAQATRPAARGLDSLEDDALLNELTTRQLTPLLDRYLEQRKLPDAQRQKIRALIEAMHTLSSANLTTRDRDAAVPVVNANADAAIEAFKDPRFFMQLSTLLIRTTVDPDARTLEYWGSNARVQVSLRPTVATTLKVLKK